MQNRHQKLSLYQTPILFYVEIPPQGTNVTDLLIIPSNIPTVLLPTVRHFYIILQI